MTLSHKQQMFVEAYLGEANGNATEAARIAGYAKPGQQGHRLLKNVEISAAVTQRVAEVKKAMGADEVLERLTDMARGTMADFLNVQSQELDLEKAEKAGKLHLIKSFKKSFTRFGPAVSIELYDAQSALEKLGRHHGLFTDKVEHSGPGGGAIPIREVRVNLMKRDEPVDG